MCETPRQTSAGTLYKFPGLFTIEEITPKELSELIYFRFEIWLFRLACHLDVPSRK